MLSHKLVFNKSENFTSDSQVLMPPTIPINHKDLGMKQTKLPISWLSGTESVSSDESSSSEEEKSNSRAAKLYWTRVKSLDDIKS